MIKEILKVRQKLHQAEKIRLEVFPFGKIKGPNSNQLIKFYESFGFKGDNDEMVLVL
jgi:DNA relaxase NicK